MNTGTAKYVINVVTRDQVGIIANVSDALFRLGGNLEALSQTVVWGWFTMIVCGTFPEDVAAGDIATAVENAGDYRAIVLPHREGGAQAPGPGEPFVVTVKGDDKPGIVRRLTRCFSEKGINIDDVWFEVHDGQFIVIGFASGAIPQLPANQVLLRNRRVTGVDWGAWVGRHQQENNEMLADIVVAIGDGRLSPVEPIAYPLDQAAQALQDQLDRKIVGKTVLVP